MTQRVDSAACRVHRCQSLILTLARKDLNWHCASHLAECGLDVTSSLKLIYKFSEVSVEIPMVFGEGMCLNDSRVFMEGVNAWVWQRTFLKSITTWGEGHGSPISLLDEFQRSNSGCQASTASTLSAEPSCWHCKEQFQKEDKYAVERSPHTVTISSY